MENKLAFKIKWDWVRILPLQLISCTILGKLLISELKNNAIVYLHGLLERLRKIMYRRVCCLEHSRYTKVLVAYPSSLPAALFSLKL